MISFTRVISYFLTPLAIETSAVVLVNPAYVASLQEIPACPDWCWILLKNDEEKLYRMIVVGKMGNVAEALGL